MRRRDKPALDQGIDDPLRAGDEFAVIGFAAGMGRRLAGRQHQDWKRLIGFSDKLYHFGARPGEGDSANIDRIEKFRKRCQQAFHQRRMPAEEALPRKLDILEIGGKQEKRGFVWIG